MKKRKGVKKSLIVVFFAIVIAVGALITMNVSDHANDISLGLDLQGGFEVLYEVEPVDGDSEVNRELLTDTVSALNARIDVLGVSEPNITIEGEDRIRVQLAGVTDQQSARELLSTEARLSFRDTNDVVMMDGSDLVQGGARQNFDPDTNEPIVQVTVDDPTLFEEISREISERQPTGENILAIWLDFDEGDSYEEEILKPEAESKIISDPRVWETIPSRDVVISGNFTVQSAQELAGILNAGALPVELDEIYSNSVGASLGERSMEMAINAGIVGVALIFGYMLVYYRFMGVIAVLTLTAYIYMVLVVFNWMNAVLTLPGIAALILGVGMAVDANIITFERIKDELRSGKTTMSSFRAGSRRSLSTILDANITTILAASVMYVYGTSAVQGFAVMLIVSILTSFITAVFGARLLLGLWVNSRVLNKKPRMFGVKEREISEL